MVTYFGFSTTHERSHEGNIFHIVDMMLTLDTSHRIERLLRRIGFASEAALVDLYIDSLKYKLISDLLNKKYFKKLAHFV
jgi:hypothetical protein